MVNAEEEDWRSGEEKCREQVNLERGGVQFVQMYSLVAEGSELHQRREMCQRMLRHFIFYQLVSR